MQQGVIFERQPPRVEKTEAVEKLERIAENAREILFETKTVFPFDFFPDRVVVDKNKVDLIVSRFFLARKSTVSRLRISMPFR